MPSLEIDFEKWILKFTELSKKDFEHDEFSSYLNSLSIKEVGVII